MKHWRSGGAGILLVVSFGGSVVSLDRVPDQGTEPPAVRVNLTLVQVDAVVTDKKGRYITDLGCEDFEIFEDDHRQPISNCGFVPAPAASATTSPVESPGSAITRPVPSRRASLRPDEVQRTIVLVVDDLRLDRQSMSSVRNALASFVEQQIQPADLVSVLRTGGGSGSLQQFTTDKRILRAAVDRVRFNVTANVDAFEPLGSIPVLPHRVAGPGAGELDQVRDATLTDGTIGALRSALEGLKDLPGRKSVVFFSRGYPLRAPDGTLTAFGRAAPGLVDLANHASVVIYTVDARGVATGQLTAADSAINPGNDETQSASDFQNRLRSTVLERRVASRDGVDGLSALSDPTGGLLLHGQNDLSKQMARMLEDQTGYYLIGYVPAASAFVAEHGRPAFHRIRLKVKRAGLSARSRSGFYGVPDDDSRSAPRGDAATLANALLSPFQANDVRLRLSSLFFHDRTRGNLLRSFLRVDASDLSLDQQADGSFGTRVEILAVTLDVDGRVVDRLNRVGQLRLTPQARTDAVGRNVNYIIDVPVKRPGAYQLRVALRDLATGHTGSASEFVEVPDLEANRLALSGILMIDAASADTSGTLAPTSSNGADAPDAELGATEVLRVFPPDRPIAYGLTIYNAQLGHERGDVQLETQMRLFRGGSEVVTGQARPVEPRGQTAMNALFAGGTLVLPQQMEEGEYVLQVIVTDLLAPPKRRTAVQAVDFELKHGDLN